MAISRSRRRSSPPPRHGGRIGERAEIFRRLPTTFALGLDLARETLRTAPVKKLAFKEDESDRCN